MALDKAHNCWTGPMGPDGAGLEPKLKNNNNNKKILSLNGPGSGFGAGPLSRVWI